MRWLFIGSGIVLGALALVAGVGYSLPNVHVAQVRADYRAEPESVYAVLADVEGWTEWRPSVERMAVVDDEAVERTTWRLSGPDGSMTVTLADDNPPFHLGILTDGGMFVSRWTYRIAPRDGGSRVTVTEEARIDNVLVRGLALFRRQARDIERLLRALGNRLGERTEPARLT